MARPPIITRAIRVAASKRIIEASWTDTTPLGSFSPARLLPILAMLKRNDLPKSDATQSANVCRL